MKNLLNFFRNEPKVIPEAKIEDRPPKPIHVHEWDLISKTYASPVRNMQLNQIGDKDLLQQTLFGLTVILWQCLVCKELRKEEMLGSDENTLDELIVKSEEYGPQFVEREGGKVYVIAKYQVPAAAPAGIPIR